jgi:hypothetical protein
VRHVIPSIFLVLFILGCFNVVAAEPVMPTKELKPITKGIVTVDLPYKPAVFEDADGDGIDDNGDFLDDDKMEKDVDWSKVLYIPSKYPVIGPASDPEL